MSQENVEIAKRMYAAWNDGGPTTASIYYDPDVEWHEAADLPDVGVVRGRTAVLAYLDEWVELFGPTHVEVEELIPVDADRLLSVFRFQVEGSASGIAGDDQDSTSLASATGWSVVVASFARVPKPSKPPGCRSRASGRLCRSRVRAAGRSPRFVQNAACLRTNPERSLQRQDLAGQGRRCMEGSGPRAHHAP
jgi:ketosteroid isomerase-like protein